MKYRLQKALWATMIAKKMPTASKKRNYLRFLNTNDPATYKLVKKMLTNPVIYARVRRMLMKRSRMAGFSSYGAHLQSLLG
jgi:hypothetical protein